MEERKGAWDFSSRDEPNFVHKMSLHVHLFSAWGKFANNIKDEVWHAVCYFILTIQAMKKE
jgi:hypothetical protein